ncbi:MAG: energy-coupled thiamine transporter ThiT [Lachnospiraceae bacterium]|nr:energy-coupled thiamine transporter ThiT [Lachnospiraceae bacterium]MBQ7781018.1 energy-coupled thiamine transporter ThiT [Lachnospiraceae bacterium]
MSNFIISQEDGSFALGTAGYYALVAVLLVALILCAIIVDRKQKNTKFSAKRLAVCGVCLALGFVLSYIKFEMPYGGSVTAFSMLCICIIGYFYGIKAGLLSAVAYSILQFFQSGGSYMLSPFQVCCDYFFAFTALGITGFFYKKENKFVLGYLLSIFVRGLFHTIGGYLYWMDYMPENFPQSIAVLYPIVYNYSYILLEGIITVVVLQIPAVKKMFKRLQNIATTD